MNRSKHQSCVLEPLEGRTLLSTAAPEGGAPRRLEFTGIVTEQTPGQQQVQAKAGERYVVRGSTEFSASTLGISAGGGLGVGDSDYLDRRLAASYLVTEDTTLTITVGKYLDEDRDLSTYELSVDVYPPGHGDDQIREDATPMQWPGQGDGFINWHGELNWFTFEAEEGVAYRVRTFTRSPVESDAVFAQIYDEAGTPIATHGVFIPPATGRYYAQIRPGESTVEVGYSFIGERVVDDHADSAAGATRLNKDEPLTSGWIYHERESDVFRFTALPGRHYQLDAQGRGIREEFLFGEAGVDYEVFVGANGRQWYFAKTRHTQHLRVWHPGPTGQAGARFNVLFKPVVDDHGDTPATATRLPFGQRAVGRLTSPCDADVFTFGVRKAGVYAFLDHSDWGDAAALRLKVSGDGAELLDGGKVRLAAGRHRLRVTAVEGAVNLPYELALHRAKP